METRYRGQKYELPTNSNEIYEPELDLDNLENRGGWNWNRRRRGKHEALFPKQYSLLIVSVFLLISFCFVQWTIHKVPTPLTVNDIGDYPTSFIEERARNDLTLLTAVGPRVSGSHENDILTVDLITKLLQDIDRTKTSSHKIEIDIQYPTGAFFMSFQEGLCSSYSKIPNIIVKLSATNLKSSNNSILVNCHFDTVAGSPGASDDMISCASMLEVLRVITRQNEKLKNPIIFLFNGAEENGLQGAHGFLKGRSKENPEIEGHKWSKNLKTFVNLEAAGAGGKEILFQTGPGNGWLLDIYSQVPHVFGSAIGEEIFQKGLIPSDTDYRIFRDFAKIPGLDMAYANNGWVYHTKYDSIEQIYPGTIQNMGDNLLSLIQNLGNLDFELLGENYGSVQDKMIFFDLFGLTMIVYSEKTALLLNILVATITLILAWRDANGNLTQIFMNVFSTLVSWSMGIGSAILVGVVLNIMNLIMPYYTYPALALILFGVPCMIFQVIGYSLILKNEEDRSWISGKTTLAFFILVLTFSSRAIFVFTINIAFGVFAWYFSRFLFKDEQRRFLVYFSVGEVFPITLSIYLAQITLNTFVPIMGRSGSELNPNIFVGLLTSIIITLPGTSGLVPIFLLSYKKLFLKISGLIWLVFIVAIILFVGKSPYTEKTPMRVHLIQSDRNFFNSDLTTLNTTESDSGYWLFNLDPNIPKYYPEWEENIPELKRVEVINFNECKKLYCGLGYYFPVSQRVKTTHWIPIKEKLPMEMTSRVRFDLTGDEWISPDIRRLSLSFVTSDHATIVLSPGKDWAIINWSLTPIVPNFNPEVNFDDRPTYFIMHCRGIEPERFNFTLDLIRSKKPSSSPALDMVFNSFFIHGDQQKTKSLKDLESRFPSWSYLLSFSTISNSYSIN